MEIFYSKDKPMLKAERGGDLLFSGQCKVEGRERGGDLLFSGQAKAEGIYREGDIFYYQDKPKLKT